MKAPLILRLGLAWAALRGQYQSISLESSYRGVSYQFNLTSAPKGWMKWRERLRAKWAKESLGNAHKTSKVGEH